MRRLIAFVMLLAVLAMPTWVSAHSKVVSSTPADGAVLTTAPAEIVASFNEELTSEGASFVVTDSTGAIVDQGDGRVDLGDAERKTMRVSLKSGLTGGIYVATWKVVGDDGHEVSGTITFTIKAGNSVTAPAPSQPANPNPAMPATGGESFSLWWVVLGLVFLGGGGWLRRKSLV